MKNFLLGFMMACTIMLSLLSAVLMWFSYVYRKVMKEKGENWRDYSTYADYAKHQRYVSEKEEDPEDEDGWANCQQ